MPYQELPGIGMQGLNTDTPAQALDQAYFSAGNNMRPFDGSLQTVFDFVSTDNSIADGDRSDILAFTHWIQTGSTTFRGAYIYYNGTDYIVQVITDITGGTDFVPGFEATTMLSDNPRFGQQLFAFNGVMIVNDSVNQPIVVFDNPNYDDALPISDSNQPFNAQFVLGWLSEDADNPSSVQAPLSTRVTCERIVPYNNRLVALNIQGDYLDDTLGNSSIVWSTPIDELNSLNGLTFRFTANNSAGDDILTETPGEVLDAGTLGTYLIVYKDDAVYRYTDTGSPLFLVGEPLFVDDGLYSPDCFVDIGGGKHFVVGNYGVYMHDGGPNKQNISRGKVQDTLYSAIETRDNTFVFHHQNDKEVWICYDTMIQDPNDPDDPDAMVLANRAHVYNYEQNTWYTRNLPLGTRGIESIQQGGQLYIYAFGKDLDGDEDVGIVRLSDERDGDEVYLDEASVEFHYLGFGDHSKVKYLSTVYPHTSEMVLVNIDSTNNLGILGQPDFADNDDIEFDALDKNTYKLDYRIHGRYFHIRLANTFEKDANGMNTTVVVNPEITGFGTEMKLAGDR